MNVVGVSGKNINKSIARLLSIIAIVSFLVSHGILNTVYSMKNISNKKLVMLIVSIICIILLITPICNAGLSVKDLIKKNDIPKINDYQEATGTEYWALIFAVGIYKNHPDQDRPSMLEAADNLYDVLVDSAQWQPDHIHKVTGSQATGQNLIKELIWLIQSEDSDDMSLIYIATHGSPLKNANGMPVDLPPKDEADGADEILVMYDGFDKWYAFIWDDLLNFFLNLLDSQGVCLIVDSCYSGGFNDCPYGETMPEYTVESFVKGFAEDVATQGRVVLMSSEEFTPSWGSYFSEFLTYGFEGYADLFGNGDGINSAEEAFNFAKPWVELFTEGRQHPTIMDLYSGEFPVTS